MNVVLDLMIHDIDLVQTIVGAPISAIDAVGTPVFSEEIDIANARIRFANGCVANATASRVSLKTERKLRIFEDDAYLSLDLQQKILTADQQARPRGCARAAPGQHRGAEPRARAMRSRRRSIPSSSASAAARRRW